MKRMYYVLLAFIISFSMIFATVPEVDAAQVTGTVTATVLNVREQPTTTSKILTQVKQGQVLSVSSETYSGWRKIQVNGKTGYVSGKYVQVQTTQTPVQVPTKKAYVNVSSLNMRSGRGTTYSVVTVLAKGAAVDVYDTVSGWSKISYNGRVGYVSAQYLSLTGTTQPTPSPVNTKTAWVNTNGLNVRSGRGTQYAKIATLSAGKQVQVIDTVNGWSKISYDSKIGYVASTYLTYTKQPTATTSDVVIISGLNVRNSYYSSATKIGTLNKGTSVQIVSSVNGWYKIKYGNGYGYVSGAYVKRSGDTDYVITVNTATNQLRYEYKGTLIKSFSVATGKSSTPTPLGITTVYNKIVNRPYFKTGIPGGDPRNPLGNRWIGLNLNNTKGQVYAIHGNNDETSIGKHISGGCIRMHNTEVRWLYDQVSIGTKVVVQK